MDQFVNSLVGAQANMEVHVNLQDTDNGAYLDGMKGQSDYTNAGEYHKTRSRHCEGHTIIIQ